MQSLSIKYKTFSTETADIDAENQSRLYNEEAKDLAEYSASSKQGILARTQQPNFDPKGLIYAIQSEKYIGYCQAQQVTPDYIRIGYPWGKTLDSQTRQELFEKAVAYYKQKFATNEILKFEVNALHTDWEIQNQFIQQQGFQQVQTLVTPTIDLTKLDLQQLSKDYEFEVVGNDSFESFNTIVMNDTENARLKPTKEFLQAMFTNNIDVMDPRPFYILDKEGKRSGFVSCFVPKDKEGKYDLTKPPQCFNPNTDPVDEKNLKWQLFLKICNQMKSFGYNEITLYINEKSPTYQQIDKKAITKTITWNVYEKI